MGGGKLLLVDGLALVYRAHYALAKKPVLTATGVNTGAIHGFANTLLELLAQEAPSHAAVALDVPGPTARHALFPDYKRQRSAMPQDLADALPHLRRLVAALGVPVVEAAGHEADDVVGTLAARAEAAGMDALLVTHDKDFAQLVGPRTRLLRPAAGGRPAALLGEAEVCEEWQVARPALVADLLGLTGDAVDNIPGVPGVGPKTARTLLQAHGGLDGLLQQAAAGAVQGRAGTLLRTHAAQARLSRTLATIARDVPLQAGLDHLRVAARDDEALRRLCAELELVSLGRRLFGPAFRGGLGAVCSGGDGDGGGHELRALRTLQDTEHAYEVADSPQARAALVQQLLARESFCFDIETCSLADRSLVGISFAWRAGQAWYVPLPAGEEGAAVLEEFREVFEGEGREKVGHNLKFDLLGLLWAGLRPRGPFVDTMLAHSLLEPDQKHGMDVLAAAHLGYAPVPFSALMGGAPRRKQPSLREVDQAALAQYAAEDADVTWQLAEKLVPRLAGMGQERVFYEVEAPLLPVLVRMERTGIRLDTQALDAVRADLEATLAGLEERIFAVAGERFNINSPKQLGVVLFETLELMDRPRKTRSGQYHTSDKVLQLLAPKHAVVADVVAYRAASKLKNTYVDALPRALHPATGRLHTSYRQLVTATGRLQSNEPNLQNIPVRTPQGKQIRRAFVPAEGWQMLAADYSQIELRVMAHLARDEAMAAAFREGADIHTATAARVWDVPAAEVDEDMRRKAKQVNFGIIYGVSNFGLASTLGIHHSEAKEIIDEYFRRFPGVAAYMERVVEEARDRGYVETVAGRRRVLRDIDASNMMLRQAAARAAVNTPIQGSAADMIKVAMARVQAALDERGLRAAMLLQVHDELVFEVAPEDREEVEHLVRHHMTTALPLGDVPVQVDIGVGANWLEAH